MVRKTKNQMYVPESDEAYNDEDFIGEGITKGDFSKGNITKGDFSKGNIHIHGGALAGNEIRGLLDASYDKTIKNVDGGWVKDEDLSTGKSKVFYNPETGKTSVVHRGTVGTLSDWKNNAIYALGGKKAYKETSRYKHAKDVQRAAEAKYGNDNIITLGHSQGGLQAELLGKKGGETITLNKATRPFSNNPGKNQTDIRTTTDIVSAMNPFSKAKNTESISLKGFNPLKAHATTSLKKLGNKMIGKGMYSDSDSDSDSDCDDEDDYVLQSVLFPRPEWKLNDCKKYLKDHDLKTTVDSKKDHYRFRQVDPEKLKGYKYKTVTHEHGIESIIAYKGSMKGGTILGKMKKGFKEDIIKPTTKGFKEDIIKPTKEVIKYAGSKDGLATDLLYKGVPMALGTLGGVAGALATGGPMGGVAGNYAGQMAGKLIAQKIGRETKMGSDAQRGVGTKRLSSNKTVKKYLTSKKGGLASDLLHRGVPTVLGGIGGIAGTMEGGPVAGVVASQAGSMAGQLATDYIGKKIGVGLKKRGRPKKQDVNNGCGFHGKIQHLMEGSRRGGETEDAQHRGRGLKKGSPEMAEKMARLRALRKK